MSDASVESSKHGSVYGLMAEFDTPQELVTAAEKTHGAGYKQIDAFSPFPVEGLPGKPEFSAPNWNMPEGEARFISRLREYRTS